MVYWFVENAVLIVIGYLIVPLHDRKPIDNFQAPLGLSFKASFSYGDYHD